MEYKVTVKPYVDFIHAYALDPETEKPTYLGMMKPTEDYETMILQPDQTKTFIINIPIGTLQLKLELLGYGSAGGTTEYKLDDVLSVPPKALTLAQSTDTTYNTPIIVNTPHQIRDVMIKTPSEVRNLTNIPEWIRPLMIDPTTLKNTYKLQASEFALRGIDVTGKSWFSQTQITIPNWATQDMPEYLRILDEQRHLQIHCFGETLTTIVDVL